MKNVKNILVFFLTVVMMVLLIGGSSFVFAANVSEGNEECNVVSASTMLDESITENGESDVQYEYRMDNIADKEKTLFIKEIIVNSAGNEITLLYPYELKWPETEEEILAHYICHEGGNAEEKTLIAMIVAGRILDDAYPDNVKDILCQQGHFYLNIEFWNEHANPSEEDLAIAKAVLESPEIPTYKHYELIEFVGKLRPIEECYVLEHFAFFN